MDDIVLHPQTQREVQLFLGRPGHALLLTAPQGAGKITVAIYIAAQLLHLSAEKLTAYPYIKRIGSTDGKAIPVEAVREAIHFTTLRPATTGGITRIIIFENSHLMTVQAQNALLKTIEEPPAGTLIILTTIGERTILPTIRSRVQHLPVHTPDTTDLQAFFLSKGYTAPAIEKATLMSGGLPGLMQALLSTDASHPLYAATGIAREILQKSLFERLMMTDELAKQKQLWVDTLFILSQMAVAALKQNSGGEAGLKRWYHILRTVHEAEQQTAASAQIKLVALHFMLAL